MASWSSRKKPCAALSTAEVEYVEACTVTKEVVCLQNLLSGLFSLGLEVTYIWCDNQSCINFSENHVFHDRLKHIEIRYYYLRDMVQRGIVRIQFMTNEDQIVDVFTNMLSRTGFNYFRDKLGVVPLQRECSHPA
jgi:hypothetical protein